MRTLTNLKKLLILGILPFAMSGCLKSSDPEFAITITNPYLLQTNTGTGMSRFIPYIAGFGNEILGSVKIEKDLLDSYPVKTFANSYFESDLERSSMYETPGISSQNGTYVVTAQNAEKDKVAQITFKLNIDNKNKLGEFDADSIKFTYNGGYEITAEWNNVRSATAYYLLICPETTTEGGAVLYSRINYLYGKWTYTGSTKTKGTFSDSYGNLKQGSNYQIAIVAVSESDGGNIHLESTSLTNGSKIIKWGTGFIQ